MSVRRFSFDLNDGYSHEFDGEGDYVLLSDYEKLERSLKQIVSMWPDLGMCADVSPEDVGPNDGRMRADILWSALNVARQALDLPVYPDPEHWKKRRR